MTPPAKMKETCPSFSRGHIPSVEDAQRLLSISAPHVEGFDYFLDVGLSKAISDIPPAEIDVTGALKATSEHSAQNEHSVNKVKFWVENVKISPPSKMDATLGQKRWKAISKLGSDPSKLNPRECRELGLMYSGAMTGEFCYQLVQKKSDGSEISGRTIRVAKRFGDMPIMVMSKACHLRGKTPTELVSMKEEQNEFGGYFIVNGIERCVRLLQVPRRNHPTAIKRSNFKNRGPAFTDMGVSIRCCRRNGDQSSITNTVHYLSSGGASFRFTARKQEFLIPLVILLRALSSSSFGSSDEELYSRIVEGAENNTFLRARAELLLQDAHQFDGLHTSEECLAYLGARFRPLSLRADSTSDVDIGHFMMERYILIHLPDYSDKLECLLLLLRKLYSFAANECCVDNSDSLQNQEILLPGHLLTSFVKEKFEEMLIAIRLGFLKEMQNDFGKLVANLQESSFWNKAIDRYGNLGAGGIGRKVQVFLSTGNIVSSTGLDLMQVSGYTIVAERLNFLRYCAHFRSVHRGQFFMEMKTTSVRKLLPDQWGFLCPVHTPDGGPCGLLSHLALKCKVMAYPSPLPDSNMKYLDGLLLSLGITPTCASAESSDGGMNSVFSSLPVAIDGRVVGRISARLLKPTAARLRHLKVDHDSLVPLTLEVVCIPSATNGGPYGGLYIFTDAARVVRPVLHRATGKVEMIGPMEQPFLDIACLPEDIREGTTTHQELDSTNMLSLIASLTPFSDYNQSPRNMYQCQMGKQTMGTPCHSFPQRSDNKLYRLQNPQAPVVQTSRHGEFKMDEYPNGTNAVVAVLSYTGFDMEDAMILNKSSYERGFGHASVYKTVQVDLKEESTRIGSSGGGSGSRLAFRNKMKKNESEEGSSEWEFPTLDEDGLPLVGERVQEGDAVYCVGDSLTGTISAGKHKEKEPAYVQSVRRLMPQKSLNGGQDGLNKASITLRFNRNPVIGDKFSSRHGQKGVLSILWPQHNMPFSESGITPDIIINPHAFPSRMTIGMLIESMAGKSGSLHGMYQDATPFSFHESGDKIAVDHFGEQLQSSGFNYYGSEPLYSGVSGCLMHADLYIGVVFYQRLRHMVSDKYQVRSTGQVNTLTRQPIKGRKKGGGIRLGEMERDSLLSHGASFLLHDRLLNCSDKHVSYACRSCGDLLSPNTRRSHILSGSEVGFGTIPKLKSYCRQCHKIGNDQESTEPLVLPYVFRYLSNELAALGVKMSLKLN